MEKFKVTQAEIKEGFRKWNKEAKENKGKFKMPKDDNDFEKASTYQAEDLLYYMGLIEKSKDIK